jgi:hypothetical protein
VKQVPEDDRLLQTDEGLGSTPSPFSPDSRVVTAMLSFALIAATVFVYASVPHATGSSTAASGGEGGVGMGMGMWEHWTHELSAKLIPPGYNFYESLLSGGFAGISRGLSRIITFPLDTVKTRWGGKKG